MLRNNEVIGPYDAKVNGKSSGLSGCSDAGKCKQASQCLRSDKRLRSMHSHRGTGAQCHYLIPLRYLPV